MTNKLVSIIIPTFNRSQFLIETIESIKLQTYTIWECLIIDDGSTDDEKQIIKDYLKNHSKFTFVERPEKLPKGANSCRNFGFTMAKGDYITWFDDDDIMLSNSLEVRIGMFDEKCDMVISTGTIVDENLKNPELIDLTISTNLFKDYAMMRLHVLTPSLLFKKVYLNQKNLFSLEITRGQETELFCRLFFTLPEIKYKIINTPLFLYRRHGSSKTTKNLLYVKEYKESLSYIAMENLKRGFVLQDKEIVSKYYYILVNNFFRALEKDHLSLGQSIIKNLTHILKKDNYLLSLHFFFFSKFFILIRRGSYKLEKYYKNRTLRIT